MVSRIQEWQSLLIAQAEDHVTIEYLTVKMVQVPASGSPQMQRDLLLRLIPNSVGNTKLPVCLLTKQEMVSCSGQHAGTWARMWTHNIAKKFEYKQK